MSMRAQETRATLFNMHGDELSSISVVRRDEESEQEWDSRVQDAVIELIKMSGFLSDGDKLVVEEI